MTKNYKEIIFPNADLCLSQDQYQYLQEIVFQNIKNDCIQINIQSIDCKCANKCWQNLFQFLINQQSLPLKKLSILWIPRLFLRKAAFNQIAIGLNQLNNLQKLRIVINFKCDFQQIISDCIDLIIKNMNKNTKKLSIKFTQRQNQGSIDDIRVAQVIQISSDNAYLTTFSFSYKQYKNLHEDKALSMPLQNSTPKSLQDKTLLAFTQMLNKNNIIKLKIKAKNEKSLFNNQQINKFCKEITANTSLDNFRMDFHSDLSTNQSSYQAIENALMENKSITKICLNFEKVNYEKYTKSQIHKFKRFNKRWRHIRISNCLIDYFTLPNHLISLNYKNPPPQFFSYDQIQKAIIPHQLKILQVEQQKLKFDQDFPPAIDSYFTNLESLNIKTIIDNRRLLKYIQSNTNLNTLKINIIPNSQMWFNQNKNFFEFFKVLDKSPHIIKLHLKMQKSTYCGQLSDIFYLGKHLEELKVCVQDAQLDCYYKIFCILNGLEINTSLLSLKIQIQFCENVMFDQQNEFDIGLNTNMNNSLTELKIKTSKIIIFPPRLGLFYEKIQSRQIGIVQYIIFQNQISPFLNFNPQLLFWDLYW